VTMRPNRMATGYRRRGRSAQGPHLSALRSLQETAPPPGLPAGSAWAAAPVHYFGRYGAVIEPRFRVRSPGPTRRQVRDPVRGAPVGAIEWSMCSGRMGEKPIQPETDYDAVDPRALSPNGRALFSTVGLQRAAGLNDGDWPCLRAVTPPNPQVHRTTPTEAAQHGGARAVQIRTVQHLADF
jgi:hypothetical protein